ncbi:hypothetical protein PF008_g20823 [Phytophthora fragariae]|uniref:BRCA2 OB1 domain-containing protein n=1 Tax=Phytophthora fragariae TaxID=53985 RepID=A0A6G0QYC7_9STRA|nr:hypothetical protein PF008_g20823 [Phytophthora fragariae]
MVTSLFTTGSGRAVSVSKERLQAYETKLHAAEESVALSAATQPAAVDSSGAGGGAGRGGSATMVTSLFTTGSGRAVSVSKERLQAYETKLHAAEESVALSAATQPAMNDQTLQGDAGTVVSEGAAVLPFPAKNNDSVDQELPPCWNMALVLTDGWYSVNEKRPTIDVCVCVVLVTGRETQDGSSVAAKRQEEISLLDPAIKPKESRYVEHVFVTDQSCHLMSIRVSGMEVTLPKMKGNSPLKRGASSPFVFRRGNKNIWKEGAILCLRGLEVSHYDEQLRVLDCVLVESTQIVSFPSKKSPFWDNFHTLQRELGISTARGSPSQRPSSNFAEELMQLKKYVERDILRMDFIPSQECVEHHVEVVEQERLTQDLQAHEEGGASIASDHRDTESHPQNRYLPWDGSVVKVLPLLGSSKFMFPPDVVAFACLSMKIDGKAFRTVYLTRELLITMKSLLLEAFAEAPEHLCQKESQSSETDFALVQSVMYVLAEINQHRADSILRFEVRQSTNERLINSWKPWERFHASYWMGVTLSTTSTPK